MTEGECVTLEQSLTKSDAGSFRQTPSATFLPEEGLVSRPFTGASNNPMQLAERVSVFTHTRGTEGYARIRKTTRFTGGFLLF